MTMPFHGCRVLDLGIITAGAATAALLADMGAEVIKVESPTYRDPFRGWAGGPVSEPGGLPPLFRATNRNKGAVSIDLKRPEGREAFLRLASKSDVVVENFRRGVLQRLGIDYAALTAVNPDIILASISSQGETGPDANYVSYGSTLEATGGMTWLTGYENDVPVISGRDVNYPDQVAAIYAAGMIATAWCARRQGAGGVHLDLSQRELTTFLCGEEFVSKDIEFVRMGNAQAPYVLQDCFHTADDHWLAVTVNHTELHDLHGIIGCVPDRDLYDRLSGWVGRQTCADALAALGAAGIATADVLGGRRLLENRDLLWGDALCRADDGGVFKGFPFQFAGTPLAIRRDAPSIGADTAQVLASIGGYSADEIAALARAGVVEISSESDAASRRAPPPP